MNEKLCTLNKFSRMFVPKGPINNKPMEFHGKSCVVENGIFEVERISIHIRTRMITKPNWQIGLFNLHWCIHVVILSQMTTEF